MTGEQYAAMRARLLSGDDAAIIEAVATMDLYRDTLRWIATHDPGMRGSTGEGVGRRLQTAAADALYKGEGPR